MTSENTQKPIEIDRTKTYKVFISYCWTNPEHENWVQSLAERLTSDGIMVVYDKWDLKEGQDKNAFMESIVTDETINKVLVICNKKYKEKADKRQGGVGTETQIITSEIYEKIEQIKFIPIIAETGEEFDSYMPVYIKARIAIDLSRSEIFEDGYEKLLRAITERPKHRRPKLGMLPAYLFEEDSNDYGIRNILTTLKNNLYKNPQQALSAANDFLNEFEIILGTFQVKFEDLTEPYDEIIYGKIHDMLKLRDIYIDFIDSWSKNSDLFDIDKIIKLFEKLHKYTYFHEGRTFIEEQTDHYKFFITELFLFTNLILLKNELYENVAILINTKYFIDLEYATDSIQTFKIFQHSNVKSLNDRNKRLGENFISYTADTLIRRSFYKGVDFKNKIIETDLLLYYISNLTTKDLYSCWFPMTYIYAGNGHVCNFKIDLLKRLIGKRHCEKTKSLFNTESVEELKELFRSFDEEINKNMRYVNSFACTPSLSRHINYDEIATSI